MVFSPESERRHHGLLEEWTFEVWSPDSALGAYTTLVVRPDGTTWYAAAVVRSGEPLIHVCEPAGPVLRNVDALLLKAEGLWAEHECESPFEQWTIANETYGVELDDPTEALGRAYGSPAPVAFDWEWYAASAPVMIDGGYRQLGSASVVIELGGGSVNAELEAARTHRWGSFDFATAPPDVVGLSAPFRYGSLVVDRRLTIDGWTLL